VEVTLEKGGGRSALELERGLSATSWFRTEEGKRLLRIEAKVRELGRENRGLKIGRRHVERLAYDILDQILKVKPGKDPAGEGVSARRRSFKRAAVSPSLICLERHWCDKSR